VWTSQYTDIVSDGRLKHTRWNKCWTSSQCREGEEMNEQVFLGKASLTSQVLPRPELLGSWPTMAPTR
jgi:hypothetical protein